MAPAKGAPEIQIQGAATVGSGLGRHTEYSVATSIAGRQLTVARRYRDFLALDERLQAVPGYSRPALPPKGVMGLRHRLNLGTFNDRRREVLETFLASLLSQAKGCPDHLECLADFLGVERDGTAGADAAAGGARGEVLNEIDPLEKYGLPKPIFMVPKRDADETGDNGIVEVAFGESEDVDGVEVTVIFKDEDRPDHAEDVVYDAIRKRLFGRQEDIETFTFVRGKNGKFESILFKGTFSGDQGWSCKVPAHLTKTVSLSEFAKEGSRFHGTQRTIIWINVWNHLFGPRNNNMDLQVLRVKDYPCTCATRREVDKRYHGMITTLA